MTLLADTPTAQATAATSEAPNEQTNTQLVFVLALLIIPALIAVWVALFYLLSLRPEWALGLVGVAVLLVILLVAALFWDWLLVRRFKWSLERRSLIAIALYTPITYPIWLFVYVVWSQWLAPDALADLPRFWQEWMPEVLTAVTIFTLFVAYFFLFRKPGLGCIIGLLIPTVVGIGLIVLSLHPSTLGRVLALSIMTIGTLLPALIYSFFLKTRVPTIRQEFEVNVMRLGLDPQAEHLHQKFNDTYGRGNLEEVFQTPILALTIILLLGWITVLFPETVADLLEYPKDSPLGIRSFVFPQLTPVGFGFLGTYLFSINVLFRRYVNFDIKHGVFVSLSTRFIVVMILVWALSLLGTVASGSTTAPATGLLARFSRMGLAELLLVSFFAGIFPQTIMLFLENIIHTILRGLRFIAGRSRLEERGPLSDIEGLTLWDENRLLEEGIENKQNLATANIVNLLLQTPFPPERLMDWIDQALWQLHVGPKAPKYLEHGIRTATDFLNVYRDNRETVTELVKRLHEEPEHAEVLVSTLGSDPNIRHILHWRLHDMPKGVSWLIERGRLALEQEDWKQAGKLFDQALTLYLAPEAYVGRAQASFEEEDFDRAKESLEHARELDAGLAIPKELADLYLETARRHFTNGKYEAAIQDLEEARTVNPALPRAEWFARVYERHAQALLEEDPELQASHEAVIRDVEQLVTIARPEDLARWGIKLEPLAQAYVARGEVHESRGKYDAASMDYATATQLNPDLAQAWNLRAFLHAEHLKAELEEATHWAQRAVELSARDTIMRARTLDTLGWVYYQRDMFDEAITHLTESLKLRPGERIIQQHLDAATAARLRSTTVPSEPAGAETVPVPVGP